MNHAYPPSAEEYRSAQSSNTSLPRYSNNGSNGSNQPSPLNPSTPYRPAPRHPLAKTAYVATELKEQPPLPNQRESDQDQNYRRAPLPTGLAKFYRSLSGQAIADSGKDERHVKLPRLGYLDGLKFIAAWIVLNGTLFDAVLAPTDLTPIQRNSPLYIFRSVGCYFSFILRGCSFRCIFSQPVLPISESPSFSSSPVVPSSLPSGTFPLTMDPAKPLPLSFLGRD